MEPRLKRVEFNRDSISVVWGRRTTQEYNVSNILLHKTLCSKITVEINESEAYLWLWGISKPGLESLLVAIATMIAH